MDLAGHSKYPALRKSRISTIHSRLLVGPDRLHYYSDLMETHEVAEPKREAISLDQYPALSRRANRERFLSRRWAIRFAAFLPFILVLLTTRVSLPVPRSLWDALFFASLLWAIVVFLYSLMLVFGLVGIRCPRCSGRYGAGDNCPRCGLPRHFAITPE